MPCQDTPSIKHTYYAQVKRTHRPGRYPLYSQSHLTLARERKTTHTGSRNAKNKCRGKCVCVAGVRSQRAGDVNERVARRSGGGPRRQRPDSLPLQTAGEFLSSSTDRTRSRFPRDTFPDESIVFFFLPPRFPCLPTSSPLSSALWKAGESLAFLYLFFLTTTLPFLRLAC